MPATLKHTFNDIFWKSFSQIVFTWTTLNLLNQSHLTHDVTCDTLGLFTTKRVNLQIPPLKKTYIFKCAYLGYSENPFYVSSAQNDQFSCEAAAELERISDN